MSEFMLQHLIAELLDELGANTSKIAPDELIEFIQKSLEQNRTITEAEQQNYVQKLGEINKNSEFFLTKYKDLKEKNVDGLDNYIKLIYNISQNGIINKFIKKSAKKLLTTITTSSSSTPSTSRSASTIKKMELTKDDLPQVKNRLKKATITKTKYDKSSSISTSQLNRSLSNNSTNLPIINTPSIIPWIKCRPTMSWDFPQTNISTITTNAIPPTVSQENAIIEDLLNVLIGIPGCLIIVDDMKKFHINECIQPALHSLILQILPLANYYSEIQHFIEEKICFEYGQCNNALAEAMKLIIKDYMLFITELENEYLNGELNLQKLWYYIMKYLPIFDFTSQIASAINKSNAKGGKVLTLLYNHIITSVGHERTELCLKTLLESATIPYMKMLTIWINYGIIIDPQNEFLIEDNEIIEHYSQQQQLQQLQQQQNEDIIIMDYATDYWDKKYFIKRERIPKFLENISDIILKTGKYLNVYRQCNQQLTTTIRTTTIDKNMIKLEYKMGEKFYIDKILLSYNNASLLLLNMLFIDKHIIEHLKSCKHYFLMEKGDFIMTFMLLCEKELSKDVADVNYGRIEAMLDLSIRLSSAKYDQNYQNLTIKLLQLELKDQLYKILIMNENMRKFDDNMMINDEIVMKKSIFVINLFTFDYHVNWPISLIINQHAISCYQMLFRHLFASKYVECLLCQIWSINKVGKSFDYQSSKYYRNAFILRQRMLQCVQNLEYHMMVEVIEPHWNIFFDKLQKVNNIDEILIYHRDFLDSCLNDCMLTIPELLTTIIKLLEICVEFCRFMQNDNMDGNKEKNASFCENIKLYDIKFTTTLLKLLEQINAVNHDTSQYDRLLNLLYRLDFNSFYSKRKITTNLLLPSSSSSCEQLNMDSSG